MAWYDDVIEGATDAVSNTVNAASSFIPSGSGSISSKPTYQTGESGFQYNPITDQQAYQAWRMKLLGSSDQEIMEHLKKFGIDLGGNAADLNSLFFNEQFAGMRQKVIDNQRSARDRLIVDPDKHYIDAPTDPSAKKRAERGPSFFKPQVGEAYQGQLYDPDAVKNFEAYKEYVGGREEEAQQAQDDLSTMTGEPVGTIKPTHSEEEWSDLYDTAENARTYAGIVPRGSAVVDGTLMSSKERREQEEANKEELFTQYPFLSAMQPQQLQEVNESTQPQQQTGNIGFGAPAQMRQDNPTVTPSGGVDRNYSAIGGSQFRPQQDNRKKPQQSNYGGGNIGYGGGIAPKL